jgi:hypothetical protein
METGGSSQHASVSAAEQTQHALLEAHEHLYTALRRPQPMRERRWAEVVSAELARALGAVRDHRLEVEGRHGLYAEILRDAPWAAPRIRQISAQLGRVEAETIDLQIEVARVEAGDNQALPVVREEAERILRSVRDILNKESDLIYERFAEYGALD